MIAENSCKFTGAANCSVHGLINLYFTLRAVYCELWSTTSNWPFFNIYKHTSTLICACFISINIQVYSYHKLGVSIINYYSVTMAHTSSKYNYNCNVETLKLWIVMHSTLWVDAFIICSGILCIPRDHTAHALSKRFMPMTNRVRSKSMKIFVENLLY